MQGSTGELLLQLLEMRLDNTIFRLGMAPTVAAARQLVSHGHIQINGASVDIPSFQVKPGMQVTIVQMQTSAHVARKAHTHNTGNFRHGPNCGSSLPGGQPWPHTDQWQECGHPQLPGQAWHARNHCVYRRGPSQLSENASHAHL